MSKILGSWSGMRKYLEEEILADSLKGRIRYNCASYVGMDGCRIFEIFIDKKLVKQFSWETVNSYFIKNKYSVEGNHTSPMEVTEYWYGFWKTLKVYPITSRTEYTDEEFCDALAEYRNQPIQDSINSENPLVIMFAIFDRRVGKRTILKLIDSLKKQPEWLQNFYKIRLEAEKL